MIFCTGPYELCQMASSSRLVENMLFSEPRQNLRKSDFSVFFYCF